MWWKINSWFQNSSQHFLHKTKQQWKHPHAMYSLILAQWLTLLFHPQVSCFLFLERQPLSKMVIFSFNIFIYLFAASSLSCIMQDLLLGHAKSLVVVLWRCGAQALEQVGSAAVVHGLSSSMACGILVPWWGNKPMSPALQGKFLTTGPPGKSPKW